MSTPRVAAALEIGRQENRKPVFLTAKERSTHMQVLGASGRGKSKFLEHMIRSDIEHDEGLCLIDPHGYLYDDVVQWCTDNEYLEDRKIVLFDPSENEWTFGFNPLNFGDDDTAFCVDSMVKACAQVWGGEDTSQTPLLKRCLRATFHALVENNLSLLETLELTTNDDASNLIREHLTSRLTDRVFQAQWGAFNKLARKSPRTFEEKFSSTSNRIIEFLASERVRNIIGQTERVMDLRTLMDEGYIVLVNLAAGSKLSDDNARLLGTLLVNDFFLKARSRPAGSRPFYLYIDECSLFINEDIGRILDEARKFGLHLILAHQHLEQLKKAGDAVYQSVLTNAQTKVVFGGLSPDDARVMAELVFMGEFDLQESKRTFDRPTVVRYIRSFLTSETNGSSISHALQNGFTRSEGTTTTDGHSSGDVDSHNTGRSEMDYAGTTTSPYEGAPPIESSGRGSGEASGTGYSETWQETYSEARAKSFAKTVATTDTKGESRARSVGETLEPVIEWLPGQPFSLAEQVYKSMALMINQSTQSAIVKRPNTKSTHIRTPNIAEPYAGEERISDFKQEAHTRSDFTTNTRLISEELAQRRIVLEDNALEYKQMLDQAKRDKVAKSARE